MAWRICLAAAAAFAGVAPAAGQEVAAQAATAASDADTICTDRPTKSNYACTVLDGHVQYEADILNASSLTIDGVTTQTLYVTNPTFKFGVAADADVEANISPDEIVRTRDAGRTSTLSGVGDLYLRFKYEPVNLGQGAVQLALLPYLKVPTARVGIGDGALEGGLLAPFNYKLNNSLTFTAVPEVDELKDSDSAGHHLNTAQTVNLALALPHNLVLYGELWGDWNLEPHGVIREYSADGSIAYIANARLQFDIGLNAGLNRATPAAQVYIGVSQRF